MGQFSFDVVSDFDKAEMNNVYDQSQREIAGRYDFKGTSAKLEWVDDKAGFKMTGDNQFQLDSIIDIVRKKAATRNISQKTFDSSKEPVTSNLKMTWEVPLVKGLSQERAKKITALLRDKLPKLKAQIQGEEIRIVSSKKDELQAAIQLLREQSFDFPLQFTNFR